MQPSEIPLLPTDLGLDTLSRPASVLMQVLSLLNHGPIPEYLLNHEEGHLLIEEYPPADRLDNEVIPDLFQKRLIRRDEDTKVVSVYPLVRETVRQRMDKDELSTSFQIAVVLLNAHWEYDRYAAFESRVIDWGVAGIVVPHVIRLAKHFQSHEPTLPPASLGLFMSLVTRVSICLQERANWGESVELAKTALHSLQNHQDTLGEQYADALMCLSRAYHSLGDWVEGITYAQLHFKQRLLVENRKPRAEQDDFSRAMAYTELSLSWVLNDDYDEAITLALQGREILEKTPEFLEGKYWPHWADYHHAWALIGLGRAEEARPILTKMLEWRRSKYGDDDTESMKTAYALQILGVVNEKTGDIDAAISTWERSLELYRKAEGDSSFRANQVRVKLGEYYGKRGEIDMAAITFKIALDYFTGEKYHKAERARASFKQSVFFESIGQEYGAADARREAERMFLEVCIDGKGVNLGHFYPPLTLADYDAIVMIMSR
ncbi:uncharacterized protein C8A04DRAFT_30646 [Dichotomopilus funicola]|uniref:DUF7779 domain-containing protein n=1 Tax=Dichotomopilus funicola TaxID=1934379 RepID=A0AAN6ZLL9_9PEZI|nr:hypothetical protein C8A04DRAFT_30646 [Dichotomopilus funicola]